MHLTFSLDYFGSKRFLLHCFYYASPLFAIIDKGFVLDIIVNVLDYLQNIDFLCMALPFEQRKWLFELLCQKKPKLLSLHQFNVLDHPE